MELPEIRPEERTPLVEALLEIIRQLLDRVGHLEETNQQLRDEIARLKGQKARPDIKPSLLEASASSRVIIGVGHLGSFWDISGHKEVSHEQEVCGPAVAGRAWCL